MKYLITLLILFLETLLCFAYDSLYILDDTCISELHSIAQGTINNKDILIIRDSRGIILRFFLDNPSKEYNQLSAETLKKVVAIKEFLAKIKNSAIIEVHTENENRLKESKLKNWELSSVIADRVESEILKGNNSLDVSRIKSVGYGEFLPAKNTPYNGGNLNNRIDIIILCNITGE